MNYLRSLDEQGAPLETTYRNEFGQEYDMRRVFATVELEHPAHVREDATDQQINQAIRSYNAHLSRVQVVTYKDLVDTAERALAFEATQATGETVIAEAQADVWPEEEPL